MAIRINRPSFRPLPPPVRRAEVVAPRVAVDQFSPSARARLGDRLGVLPPGIPVEGGVKGSFRVTPLGALAPVSPPPLQPTITNQKLYDYLQANPQIKTVQDLVNASYRQPGGGWGTFENTCKDLGLDPAQVAKYRSANLMDWAAVAPPAPGMPSTPAEANAFFINQYRTEFNPYYPSETGVSNNCGPTSLAMCLQVEGKMPPGLNPEQRIDYARALMYPKLDASAYTTVNDANGNPVRLLDRDSALTAMGDATSGIVGGAAQAGISTAKQTGWGNLDDALAAGRPVVVEGNICDAWRTAVASHPPGSYAGGGDGHFIAVLGKTADGKYLVADPMYSGGTVALTKDELATFFAKQGGAPSFASI